MKYKVLALAVLATILYSCASKTAVATTEVKKEEPKVTTLTPELAEGKSLYENSCARCHRLYEAKEYSAEEWKPIVLRMAPKARLTAEQGQKIYNYVTMK